MPVDDAYKTVGRNGKAQKPILCCQKKGGCSGTIPIHIRDAYVVKGKPCDCRVCGKAYPRRLKKAVAPPAKPAPPSKAAEYEKRIKELEAKVAKAEKHEAPSQSDDKDDEEAPPKKLIEALELQKATIAELKALGPIIRESIPGGYDANLERAEAERKRIIEEIRASKPIGVQAQAAKAKVEGLDKALAKAGKSLEKKSEDLEAAQKALEDAQTEVAKQLSSITKLEADLSEAKQRQAALGTQIGSTTEQVAGSGAAKAEPTTKDLSPKERSDYDFIKFILQKQQLQLQTTEADKDVRDRITAIIGPCSFSEPRLAPAPAPGEEDSLMASAGECTELAEEIVSDSEDGEERAKKVAKLAKKLSNPKVRSVARAIGKK